MFSFSVYFGSSFLYTFIFGLEYIIPILKKKNIAKSIMIEPIAKIIIISYKGTINLIQIESKAMLIAVFKYVQLNYPNINISFIFYERASISFFLSINCLFKLSLSVFNLLTSVYIFPNNYFLLEICEANWDT